MTARFERFVEDPGLLESIDYRERSKEAYPLIEGVGLIAAEKKRFRGLTMPEDRGMAMMMWRGEQQIEKRRATGQQFVLNGSWRALAQELKDMIVECSISASSPDVFAQPSFLSGRDVLGRLYRQDAIYHGAPAAFFQHSRLHFCITDLDFSPVVEVLRGCTRQVKAGMPRNGRLAIELAFSGEYSHAGCAGRIWAWAEFCLGVEIELSGQRIPWVYLADENDDVLHAELESLLCGVLDGAEMPAGVGALIEGMHQAPLAAFS